MAQVDVIGHGTIIERSDDGTSGGVFTPIGTVRDIAPPSVSRDVEDVTHMESVERWREYIGAMKDSGELGFEITFDPGSTELASLYSELNLNTATYYRLTFTDATAWGFLGLVTAIDPTTPVETKMVADVAIKLSGKPGWI